MQVVPSGRWRDCCLRVCSFGFRSFVYITFLGKARCKHSQIEGGSQSQHKHFELAQQPVAASLLRPS